MIKFIILTTIGNFLKIPTEYISAPLVQMVSTCHFFFINLEKSNNQQHKLDWLFLGKNIYSKQCNLTIYIQYKHR